MVKQRCVICLDNTEYMRNGDYGPTRFAAQQKTVEQLIGRVLRSNPESLCSLLSMSSPTVEISLTENRQSLQSTLTQIPIRGDAIDVLKSLKIAQLAVKKRGEESTGEKRVILFVGSPLQHTTEELKKVGSMFRRYNISVDVINFGEITANQEKLEALVEAVDTDNTSHIVTVPQGPHLLSDMVASSDILKEPGQPEGGAAGSGGAAADFGMEDDPEYAMALQLSLQEYEREQQQRQQQEGGESKGTSQPQQSTTAEAGTTNTATSSGDQMEDDVDMDEDEMLRQAMEMSRASYDQQQQKTESPTPKAEAKPTQSTTQEEDAMEDDEDAELQAALRMSLLQGQQTQGDSKESIDDIMGDEAFLKGVVSNVTKDKKDDDKKDDSEKK